MFSNYTLRWDLSMVFYTLFFTDFLTNVTDSMIPCIHVNKQHIVSSFSLRNIFIEFVWLSKNSQQKLECLRGKFCVGDGIIFYFIFIKIIRKASCKETITEDWRRFSFPLPEKFMNFHQLNSSRSFRKHRSEENYMYI